MDSSSTDHTSGCGSHQPPPPETPHLCSRGCGFFGTAENMGLCSKCYTVYLNDLMAKSSEAAINGKVSHVNPSDQSKINDILKDLEIDKLLDALKLISDQSHSNEKKKNRCGLCNKKVGLLGFECRCGGTFCGLHRYPEAHPCNFDFKKAGEIAIHKENPICKPDKITDRV